MQRIRDGLREDRPRPGEIRVAAPSSPRPTSTTSRRASIAHGRMVTYLQYPGYGEILAEANGWDHRHPRTTSATTSSSTGSTRSPTASFHRHQMLEAASVIPDEWMHDSCAIGTVDECVTQPAALHRRRRRRDRHLRLNARAERRADRRVARPVGRPAKLTREQVARAAFDLVDAEGPAALTMPRLAAELGVGTDDALRLRRVQGRPRADAARAAARRPSRTAGRRAMGRDDRDGLPRRLPAAGQAPSRHAARRPVAGVRPGADQSRRATQIQPTGL